jgi:hypothetical protein
MTPRQRFLAARWGYVAVVLLETLTQLHFYPDLAAAVERLVRAFTPSLGWRDAIDGLRNTVLFAGLGAVWVVTSRSGNVRAEIRVPLASLAQRVDAFSALHVLQPFLLYLPLGSMLAVWPLRLTGR